MRNPEAYKAITIAATAFERVSAHGPAVVRNSRFGWLASCSASGMDALVLVLLHVVPISPTLRHINFVVTDLIVCHESG